MTQKIYLLVLLVFTTQSSFPEPDQEDYKSTAVKQFYSEDIKHATSLYIRNSLNSEENFLIFDEKTEELLELKFLKIHDPVRQISEEIYFACTDFYVPGNPNKIYDIDFWLDHDNINLTVYEVKIHKEPRKSLLYGWYKYPRYTFVNDEIEYLY